MAFPGATEDIKWGADLCFSVGGKMFCVTSADAAEAGMSFKCTPEKFEELIERPGIEPAAYVARYKWVHVKDPKVLSRRELTDLISSSYQLVFERLPAKVKRTIGA